MGASVGGPRTITTILKEIPRNFNAPILIVQHLSSHFTDAFADNLNIECDLKIKVAQNGENIQPGKVYIAPGDMHMEISMDNKNPIIKIFKGTPAGTIMLATPQTRLRINYKVIQELGLAVSDGLLSRADEIIR